MGWGLGMVFIVTLMTGAIAAAPARLVFDGMGGAGIQAGLVHGTIWQAKAFRLHMGGLVLSEVDAQLDPAHLLRGAAGFDVSVTDPNAQLTAQVIARADGIEFRDVEGVIRLAALPSFAGFSAPAHSFVRLDGVSITLNRRGECLSAHGAGASPILVDIGQAYQAQLPSVSLQASCAGRYLAFEVNGEGQDLTLEGLIRLEPDAPTFRLIATPHRSEVMAALSYLGFSPDGDQWIADSNAL